MNAGVPGLSPLPALQIAEWEQSFLNATRDPCPWALPATGTDTKEGAQEDRGELTSFSRSLSTRSTISTSDLSFIQATMSYRERPAFFRDISSLQKLFSKRHP